MKKLCKQCNKEFEKSGTVSKKSWLITLFCSRRCFSESRKTLTEEQRFRLGNGNRGRKLTPEWREKIGKSVFGKRRTKEQRKNYGRKGDENPMWRGGITPVNQLIRMSAEYKEWRTAVFERDNYSCTWCGAKGDINADHIKPFSVYIELRFDVENGRTLCVPCHKKTDTYGIKALKSRV